ncbi:MAG: riboflavin synthase [Gammaproteobacteria bacterium]|nr:MAG: riboflavin synthase [Gammaproteobacteria bacterium]
MFTGIVQSVGRIASIEKSGEDMRLRIDAGTLDLTDVKIGDSISVSGVCLTVVDLSGRILACDVSAETLSRSSFSRMQAGDKLNLEKALTPAGYLGGHFVSGHVDGVGRVLERRDAGRSVQLRVEVPPKLSKYIAEKGSICIDGVSLTVNSVSDSEFEVNLVPHTLKETTLGEFKTGREVNIEVDILARYLERLFLNKETTKPVSAITADFLERYGFIK